MSPKYHHFEIALIYFLLLIPWPPTNVIKILCSRDSSRLVRKIVRSKWTPILDKHQVKLPLECPLHPFRDVFAPRQDAKQRDRPTQWTCRMCGKSFYQEKHLDLHFDTRHKSIINEAEDSVCLADFCDIMRCEVFQTEDSSSLKFGDQHIVTDIEVWGDSLGQNSALAKANAAYLSLIPIRTSTLGATRAAKVQNRQLIQDKQGQSNEQSQSGKSLSPLLIRISSNMQFADAAAQDAGTAKLKSASEMLLSKLKGLGQKRQETDGTESVDEAQVNDTEQKSNDGNDDPNATQDEASVVNSDENASASNMSKVRANCKAEDLSKLKARCEYLLRSCIGSLLLSMSDQAFKEMEEEMNKAVCWYLTCDRYWEDGPLEPRAFPWGLIVILIFVLSTGICFCYYIIWILFDYLFQFRRNDNQCQQPLWLRHSWRRRQHRERDRERHLYACPPLSCRLCDAARYRWPGGSGSGRWRPNAWDDCGATATAAAVLLPTAAGPAASGARLIPRTSAISSAQSAPLYQHRPASGGGRGSGSRAAGDPHGYRGGGRTSIGIQREHPPPPSSSAATAAPPTSSPLDKPGLPTGHFRPTRLYK
ncbi:uncharacterized protein LOC115631276 isoform X3 [Scaptodrosophila lebanonensis]|uniref:Uncharacterized protein LOC115631276 isoform X3 n=1 Tax=Drosophila lebanonensis TaxID=7225 RepID=A0A6J2U7A7_DROLE|nr:uncharacterized protein LOC115631276 isoform X3 [Scaptodrosophila lebanonensis]